MDRKALHGLQMSGEITFTNIFFAVGEKKLKRKRALQIGNFHYTEHVISSVYLLKFRYHAFNAIDMESSSINICRKLQNTDV